MDRSTVPKSIGRISTASPPIASVVQRRPDLLRHTRCFICNDIEAERLLHHPVSRADPEAAVETILHYGRGMGLRSMVVTPRLCGQRLLR